MKHFAFHIKHLIRATLGKGETQIAQSLHAGWANLHIGISLGPFFFLGYFLIYQSIRNFLEREKIKGACTPIRQKRTAGRQKRTQIGKVAQQVILDNQ